MSLIVENGSGLDTAESYLSVADADVYFTSRNISIWTGADSVKEAALRKATEYLDSTYTWKGSIYLKTQSLSFPRTNIYDSQGRDLSKSVPKQLERACAELALLSLSEELIKSKDASDYVKKEKLDELEIEYRDNAPTERKYPLVDRLISDLYISKVGGSSLKLSRV